MRLKNENLFFIILVFFHTAVLLYLITTYSISYAEAVIYFDKTSLLSYIIQFSTSIIGQNDFGIRLPFVFFYILSSLLLYLLLDDYFKHKRDRLITLSIFMLLPGVNSAALLVNNSIIVIFCTLLYLYIYKMYNRKCHILLIIFLFIDNSFAILFLTLFFYAIKKKDNILLFVSLILFATSMFIYGFAVGGIPKGFIIDTFAMYASVFSPFIFIYYFYAIYRTGLKYEKDIFWYLGIVSLGLSLIFSLRQHIHLEDFAPFVVIGIPLMVKLFLHSMRIRLRIFRKVHYFIATIGILFLVSNFLLLIFNQYLYKYLQNPSKHFAYNYHIVKELSNKLKEKKIYSIATNDKQLTKRLEFYGITNKNAKYILYESKNKNIANQFNISYFDTNIKSYTLKKR